MWRALAARVQSGYLLTFVVYPQLGMGSSTQLLVFLFHANSTASASPRACNHKNADMLMPLLIAGQNLTGSLMSFQLKWRPVQMISHRHVAAGSRASCIPNAALA